MPEQPVWDKSVYASSCDTFDRSSVMAATRTRIPRQDPPTQIVGDCTAESVLEFREKQLDCFGPKDMLDKAYEILGPDHRKRGGTIPVYYSLNWG